MVVEIPVTEQNGLVHCWNPGDSDLPKDYKDYTCEEYDIPTWIEPFITFLWVLLAIDVFVALYWMNFMWVNQKCREAIFKFKDDREPLNKPLPGQSVLSCCCVACNVPRKINCCDKVYDKAESGGLSCYNRFKRCLGLPEGSSITDENVEYNFYTDVVDAKLEEEDLVFGHKAFYWPKSWPKYEMTQKKRLTCTLTIMYAPILALLVDFVCDIQYLNQISSFSKRNLLDKHIQIDNGALIVVAIWDLLSFFTIPITCALVYKMSFTSNLKTNLMGEVLIINVSYLLEDGVELMMQYYYFDKYAGVRYDYFDEVPSIINIFFSAMISFTLAVFNIFALSHLFAQLNQSGYGSTKSKVFSIFMFFLGLLPLVAMFCRVMASCYQIFTFNKYRTGCLHYEPNDLDKTLTVHQAALFDFECYRAIDWPLIMGNFVGIGLHAIMAVMLLIEHLVGTPNQIAIIKRDSLRKSTSQPKESKRSSVRDVVYFAPPAPTDSNDEDMVSDESNRQDVKELTPEPPIQRQKQDKIVKTEPTSSKTRKPSPPRPEPRGKSVRSKVYDQNEVDPGDNTWI